MKYEKLTKVTKLIKVWLVIDVIIASIYLIVNFLDGSNFFTTIIISGTLVFMPLVLYMLASAVLDAFLPKPEIKSNSNYSEPVHKSTNEIRPVLTEYVPEDRYESKIDIDDKLIKRDVYTFHKELREVTLGENVRAIDQFGFYGCEGLENIIIKSKEVVKLGNSSLDKTSKDLKILVNSSEINKYMSDPTWEPYMELIFPND